MAKLLFTAIVSFCVLFCHGQSTAGSDSIKVNGPDIKVTLLGTGAPQPIMERFGASILVQAGGQNLLFDAGRGCLQRLRQIKVEYDKLNALFLTHLHSDHIVGLPDLWLTGWLVTRRTSPLQVFGPTGTANMVKYLQKAFEYDISIRMEDDKSTPEGNKLIPVEIKQGVIYENNGVKVTAFEVDHGLIKPAFGYRVDYKGRSVLLSGDTKYSPNLVAFAKGVDLLIHEVAIAPDTLSKSDPKYNIVMHHSSPADAAKVFNEVKPRLAVFSHIVKLYGRNDKEIMEKVKKEYSGPLIMGEDLMSFSIGDSITVDKWPTR